jgi:hypothetical protein
MELLPCTICGKKTPHKCVAGHQHPLCLECGKVHACHECFRGRPESCPCGKPYREVA